MSETHDTLVGCNGLTLVVPEQYAELVIVESNDGEVPANGELFSVSERASYEAGLADGHDESWGDGWLFSIGIVDEAAFHEMLCRDMSGAYPFAVDSNGSYFMLYSPTDVRFYRKDLDWSKLEGSPDLAQWQALCEWAGGVPDSFVAANPGLTPVSYGNTELDMALANAAYRKDTHYNISTTEFGPLEPKAEVDPTPYVERLMKGCAVDYLQNVPAPDGEYVVLNVNGFGRFDFFRMEGKENYVRRVWGENGANEQLYRLSYANGAVKASEVMQEWYDALAKAHGLK